MTIFMIHHRKGGVGKIQQYSILQKLYQNADVFRKIMKREKLVLSDFIIRVNKHLFKEWGDIF